MDLRSRLYQAQSFQVYYGAGLPSFLAQTDIAIVEPSAHNVDTIGQLRAAGTIVIAYVSITEVPTYDPFYGLLKEEDWLRIKGESVCNQQHGNPLVDLTSRRWIGLLHHRIGNLLHVDGYDGVFLDTIGNVEWPRVYGMRPDQLKAAAGLVQTLKKLHPNHLLIQNNGVEFLCVQTAPWIDAICWENPLLFGPHTEWSRNVVARLEKWGQASEAVRTMLLFESGEKSERSLSEGRQLAFKNNWLISIAARHYV